MKFSRLLVTAGLLAASALAGCRKAPQTLTSDQFFRSGATAGGGTDSPTDRSGALYYDPVQYANKPADDARTAEAAAGIDAVSPDLTRQMVPTVASAATTPPPTTLPVLAEGQYLTVGFVVGVVNSVPIYANDVVNPIRPALEAEARRTDDPAQFRKIADELIAKQMRDLVVNELEVAAAQSGLDDKGKQMAMMETASWRQQQITEAGGSLQAARVRSAEAGIDFDQRLKEEYRASLVRGYYRKSIVPLIQVRAEEIRDYYKRNLDAEFTKPGQATFELLTVASDARNRDAAETLAGNARAAAVAGASQDDLLAMKDASGNFVRDMGVIGPIDRGAYRYESIEKAVWNTPKGQWTDVVDEKAGFYFARVTEVTRGEVQPFENADVQQAIRNQLERQAFQKYREAQQERLIASAVLRGGGPDQIQAVGDMVMQGYTAWRAGK